MSETLKRYLTDLSKRDFDIDAIKITATYDQLLVDLDNMTFVSTDTIEDVDVSKYFAVHEQIFVFPNDLSFRETRHVETIFNLFQKEYFAKCEQKAREYVRDSKCSMPLLPMELMIVDRYQTHVQNAVERILGRDPQYAQFMRKFNLNGVEHELTLTLTIRTWLISHDGHLAIYPSAGVCVWDAVCDDPETMKLDHVHEVIIP